MSDTLVKQTTMKPTRKVTVGNLAGGGTSSAAITAFLWFGIGRLYDGNPPADVLELFPWLVWVVTWLVTSGAGYITKHRASDVLDVIPEPPKP